MLPVVGSFLSSDGLSGVPLQESNIKASNRMVNIFVELSSTEPLVFMAMIYLRNGGDDCKINRGKSMWRCVCEDPVRKG